VRATFARVDGARRVVVCGRARARARRAAAKTVDFVMLSIGPSIHTGALGFGALNRAPSRARDARARQNLARATMNPEYDYLFKLLVRRTSRRDDRRLGARARDASARARTRRARERATCR